MTHACRIFTGTCCKSRPAHSFQGPPNSSCTECSACWNRSAPTAGAIQINPGVMPCIPGLASAVLRQHASAACKCGGACEQLEAMPTSTRRSHLHITGTVLHPGRHTEAGIRTGSATAARCSTSRYPCFGRGNRALPERSKPGEPMRFLRPTDTGAHGTVCCCSVSCRVSLTHESPDSSANERAFVGVSSGEVAAAHEAPVEAQAVPQGGWGVQGGPRVQEHADWHALNGRRIVEVYYVPNLQTPPLPSLS